MTAGAAAAQTPSKQKVATSPELVWCREDRGAGRWRPAPWYRWEHGIIKCILCDKQLTRGHLDANGHHSKIWWYCYGSARDHSDGKMPTAAHNGRRVTTQANKEFKWHDADDVDSPPASLPEQAWALQSVDGNETAGGGDTATQETDIQHFNLDVQEIKGNIDMLMTQIASVGDTTNEVRNALAEVKGIAEEVATLKSSVREINQTITEVKTSLGNVDATVSGLKMKQVGLNEVKGTIREITESIGAVQQSNGYMKSSVDEIKERIGNIHCSNSSDTNGSGCVDEVRDTIGATISNMEGTINDMKGSVDETKTELAEFKSDVQTRVHEIQTSVEVVRKTCNAVKFDMDSLMKPSQGPPVLSMRRVPSDVTIKALQPADHTEQQQQQQPREQTAPAAAGTSGAM